MIIHLVMMSFDNSSDTEESARLLRALKDEIEEIRRVDVGMNIRPSNNALDLGILMEFDTEGDLAAFLAHPAHESAAEFYRSRRNAVATCDFVV